MISSSQVDAAWTTAQQKSSDRQKGAFMRALWYGNNSRFFGQNKGARKAIRNAPRKIAIGTVSNVIGIVVPPGLTDVLTEVVDVAASAVASNLAPEKKPTTDARKNLKRETKELAANAVVHIDRNLVKLRDAKKNVVTARTKLESAHSSYDYVNSTKSDERMMTAIEESLTACAEFEYYVNKVTLLVTVLEDAASRMKNNLSQLNTCSSDASQETIAAIKAMLDDILL